MRREVENIVGGSNNNYAVPSQLNNRWKPILEDLLKRVAELEAAREADQDYAREQRDRA